MAYRTELENAAIDYVKEKVDPGDVYDQGVLEDWVGNNCDIRDVFDDDVLEDWALSNGFVRAEEELK